jgi:enoyl-CoA hydratase
MRTCWKYLTSKNLHRATVRGLLMTEIAVHISDGVGIITLEAPARRNALTVGMADELVAACDELDRNRDVGAVILRGSGGYFCAGADRALLSASYEDPAAGATFSQLTSIYQSFARVTVLTVPSIAAVRGGAVGAGVNLLLSTSLRVVAKDARIASGFSALGLHPGGGHLALLNRVAGYEATVAVGILGQALTGVRAYELGIAWQALDDAEVEAYAGELAHDAARDPELSRMVMASLQHEVGPPPLSLAAALQLERAPQMRTQRRRGESSS